MTVEANSKPPIHQRRFEIGLATVRLLFTVVAIVYSRESFVSSALPQIPSSVWHEVGTTTR